MEDLGTAGKVTIKEDKTIIVDGGGNEEDIHARAEMITSHYGMAKNDFQLDKMKTRVAKILGGVAVLHVGAASEVEMRDKMERIDDALNATRAAMEMGVIAGGGTTLVKIMKQKSTKQ